LELIGVFWKPGFQPFKTRERREGYIEEIVATLIAGSNGVYLIWTATPTKPTNPGGNG